jgi:hypothetical protein
LTLDQPGEWKVVHRDGKRDPVAIDAGVAKEFAEKAANAFKRGPDRLVAFRPALAKDDIQRAS